eukprot:TRINITY_DN821_c0_g1_i3.p1 TRINITY_DN821_c0_g1~~TRINITY_DN821_c0_g1_i3.p1  ORF type:complete len:405 (+),score=79.50 TRINITY_DN821_c0_g1_i3:1253-2467(+)
MVVLRSSRSLIVVQVKRVNNVLEEQSENFSAESVSQQDQSVLETKGSKLAKMLLSFDPLELSDLQKNVSREAVMAIKRVLTGTFGTLPSEQYTVTVETNREVLFGLLRSALYTGYVLRNLEYRLSLHKTLLLNSEEPIVSAEEEEEQQQQNSEDENIANFKEENYENTPQIEEKSEPQQVQIKGLTPEIIAQLPKEAVQYIQSLESKIEQDQQQAQLQSQNTIDETIDTDQLGIPNSSYGNDLLDLLRSLDPATAKAMAKPSSKDTDHAFHLVIESVLSRLYPTLTEQSAEITDEAQISVTRDYLARILYWSMLLGNHSRGLEYNLSLEHAFEHINVEHPVHEAEGPGMGGGFFGAIGNFFFGEGGQKTGEAENGPSKDDDEDRSKKQQQKSSRQSEKDIDELY